MSLLEFRTAIRDAIAECKVSNSVFEVVNGAEAVRFLNREGPHAEAPRPGLIFLDIEMPGLDGFGIVEALARTDSAKPLVIFVTAFPSFAVPAFDTAAIELREPCGRIHFGGDTVESSHSDGAVCSAQRIAARVEAAMFVPATAMPA